MIQLMHPDGPSNGRGHSLQAISDLFDVVGREDEVIAGLARGLDQLEGIHEAKRRLATLTPSEVKSALAFRRTGAPQNTSSPAALRRAAGTSS